MEVSRGRQVAQSPSYPEGQRINNSLFTLLIIKAYPCRKLWSKRDGNFHLSWQLGSISNAAPSIEWFTWDISTSKPSALCPKMCLLFQANRDTWSSHSRGRLEGHWDCIHDRGEKNALTLGMEKQHGNHLLESQPSTFPVDEIWRIDHKWRHKEDEGQSCSRHKKKIQNRGKKMKED